MAKLNKAERRARVATMANELLQAIINTVERELKNGKAVKAAYIHAEWVADRMVSVKNKKNPQDSAAVASAFTLAKQLAKTRIKI